MLVGGCVVEVARGLSDSQHGVQFGDRQHTADQPPRTLKDQSTTGVAELVISAEEHGQPGGAQERQPGQVEHDFRVAIPAKLIEYLL